MKPVGLATGTAAFAADESGHAAFPGGTPLSGMDPETTITEYYDALETGGPLGPYFAEERTDDDSFVKFGISERLVGAAEIRAGLRRQTETTTDWVVTSQALRVCEREQSAWFSDRVSMAWTNTETGTRREFDTRWSGTLEDRDGWQFVGMHVSTADRL
jgi:hypothetical protein